MGAPLIAAAPSPVMRDTLPVLVSDDPVSGVDFAFGRCPGSRRVRLGVFRRPRGPQDVLPLEQQAMARFVDDVRRREISGVSPLQSPLGPPC